jgi:hypothetical protein
MPDAGAIRMGGAYVEISADDAPMLRRLRESQARLKQWVAENSGPALNRGTEAAVLAQGQDTKGFLSGGFKGMQIAETGLKFATAIAAVKVAIKDVQMFSALFRGDMEGARKAAEELPFGLGEIVKELSGPVDAAMKWFVFRLRGLDTDDSADRAAAAKAKRDRDEGVAAWNRYVNAVHSVDRALAQATMSAEEFARYEVDGLRLAQTEAEVLLAKKLRLIQIEQQRKAYERFQETRARGENLIAQAMDQYARATMSEREFLAYEVRHLGLAANQAETLLNWRLAILDVTEKQHAAEKRKDFDTGLAATMRNLELEAGVLRGTFDAFDVEVTRAAKPLDEAMDAGLINFDEYNARLEKLKAAMAELRAAREADAARREGQSLTESMQTPEERAKAQIEKYKKLLDAGDIAGETYQRAVRKALEDAAAAMPDAMKRTIGARGTFSAIEAAGMGAGGVSDRIASATEATAKNTEKIAKLAANLGVNFG